jgi:hypothetical protein
VIKWGNGLEYKGVIGKELVGKGLINKELKVKDGLVKN